MTNANTTSAATNARVENLMAQILDLQSPVNGLTRPQNPLISLFGSIRNKGNRLKSGLRLLVFFRHQFMIFGWGVGWPVSGPSQTGFFQAKTEN